MGNFAQQVHPLTDVVKLAIRRVNSTSIDIVTVSSLHCIIGVLFD